MKIPKVGSYILGCCVAVAVIAGCGGGFAQPGPSVGFPQIGVQSRFGRLPGRPWNTSDAAGAIDVAALQLNHSRSWMLPEAKNEELLYVANYYTNIVRV